jgi:phosphatidylglycerol:prolipoprotein diacylglycerol transferase
MQPELDIGPLTLQTFGICFAVAFLLAGGLVARRLTEIGEPGDWSYELIFAALIGGLVGARVDYLIQNWSEVSDDLLGSIFSGSGLVWLGGLIGGTIGVVLWAWWRDFLGLRLLDLCAPGLALGYAIGRVGCQLSGDGDYGIESDLPWAMAYPEGTVATDQEVHPTPVYETLAMGFAALVLWHLRDRYRPGVLFAIYLVIAGVERLLIEFIRRNDEVLIGLTQAQLVSVVMTAAGIAWLLRARSRGGLAAPPAEATAR